MRFPIHNETPITHSAELPDAADLVVIGGGIAGVSTAIFAAEQGLKVVLLEKGRIAGEQSSRNWGWIRAQGRDAAEIPVMLEAAAHWRRWDAALGGATGLQQTGVCYLAEDDATLDKYADWLPHAQAHGMGTRILTAKETADLLPGNSRAYHGALWTAEDMRAEPWQAVPALARMAAEKGALIREGCAVRGLDIAAGRVGGVITEGGTIRAEAVILAGGAWSSLLLRRHGVSIPQLSVRCTVAATGPMPEIFAGGAVDSKLAFRRRMDGGYSLAPAGYHELYIGPDAFRAFRGYLPQLWADPMGTVYRPLAPRGFPDGWSTPRRWALDGESPFERMRILDPAPNEAKVAEIKWRFEAAYPELGPIPIMSSWAGMIDTMPDVVPVVDAVSDLPGLTVVTGMSGHGFGIGPAFGRIAVAMATGEEPGHDMSRFRYGRFHDGSRLVPGPNL